MTTDAPTWFEQYLAAWDTLDIDTVMAWFTDDIVYEDTTLGHGAEGTKAMAKFAQASFTNVPEARFEFIGGTEGDNGYAIEWVMHPMKIRGVSIGVRRDGKIAENRDYWNGAAYTVPNT